MINGHLKLYRSLNKNKVRYLVIGGVACGIYGSPRATLDVDIFIEPSLENAKKLLKALRDADFGTASLTTPEKILANEINIFEDYIKLDVFIKPKGIQFSEVWPRRETRILKGVRIKVLSINDLVVAKSSSKRLIDKEDIKILKQIKRIR